MDPSTVTVSGLSAGAAMATQFHFAHSSEVFGVGMIAGRQCTESKTLQTYSKVLFQFHITAPLV